ncbi:hypothetical protein Golob_025985 [Gossypium lobatum]|uniref:Uncharacterized protein n=1 Tax=Gossypium lobatum TaxID=34289 RepID=A0A7J8LTX3_9ROSI|nr:hypothetical protein [Gossypium lobatum]
MKTVKPELKNTENKLKIFKTFMVEMLSSLDSESEDEKSSASSIKKMDLADDTTLVTITRTKKR